MLILNPTLVNTFMKSCEVTVPAAAGVSAVVEPAEAVGPAFPTLGVTLDFLERFVSEKVAGKPSRYCIAKVDCIGNDADDELSFKAGEILGIGELTAVNDGWLLGYRRAGNWADR